MRVWVGPGAVALPMPRGGAELFRGSFCPVGVPPNSAGFCLCFCRCWVDVPGIPVVPLTVGCLGPVWGVVQGLRRGRFGVGSPPVVPAGGAGVVGPLFPALA